MLIHAVGELIRLAGVKLISAVLVDADKNDESLGELDPQSQSARIRADTGRWPRLTVVYLRR